MSAEYFFRNDDIRGEADDALIKMQDLFVRRGGPIIHAVEPANFTEEVAAWLLEQQDRHPELFALMQHGLTTR